VGQNVYPGEIFDAILVPSTIFLELFMIPLTRPFLNSILLFWAFSMIHRPRNRNGASAMMNLLGHLWNRFFRPAKKTTPCPSIRLRLEALEDRHLLSVIPPLAIMETATDPGPMPAPLVAPSMPQPILTQAPNVNANGDKKVDVGVVFSGHGSFQDQDSTLWLGWVEFGDGSSASLVLENRHFAFSHQYDTPGEYTVVVHIADNCPPFRNIQLLNGINR
jgi:hypothetical protein